MKKREIQLILSFAFFIIYSVLSGTIITYLPSVLGSSPVTYKNSNSLKEFFAKSRGAKNEKKILLENGNIQAFES